MSDLQSGPIEISIDFATNGFWLDETVCTLTAYASIQNWLSYTCKKLLFEGVKMTFDKRWNWSYI